MRIMNNISAMCAGSNYMKMQLQSANTMEKLSSGFRINSAADDAAGLAISEKMRNRLSALNRDADNVYEGIDLIQTAEGALNEIHEMLRRTLELAEQSANGTYDNEVDRQALQEEVDQLMEESDRIVEYTNFNGIFPLRYETEIDHNKPGVMRTTSIIESFSTNIPASNNEIRLSSGKAVFYCQYNNDELSDIYEEDIAETLDKFENDLLSADDLTVTLSWSSDGGNQRWNLSGLPSGFVCNYKRTEEVENAGSSDRMITFYIEYSGSPTYRKYSPESYKNPHVEMSVYADSNRINSQISDRINEQIANGDILEGGSAASKIGFTGATSAIQCSNSISAEFPNKTGSELLGSLFLIGENGSLGKYQFTDNSENAADGYVPVEISQDSSAIDIVLALRNAVKDNGIQGYSYSDEFSSGAQYNMSVGSSDSGINLNINFNNTDSNVGAINAKIIMMSDAPEEKDVIRIFAGDSNDDYNWIDIPIFDLHVENLGLENVDISTQENAANAMESVKEAINIVSGVRGRYGAIINRLQHSINNLYETSQNEQASESAIRDADMAKEVTAFTKHNIIMQAGQAMLAQANQQFSGVLNLLR